MDSLNLHEIKMLRAKCWVMRGKNMQTMSKYFGHTSSDWTLELSRRTLEQEEKKCHHKHEADSMTFEHRAITVLARTAERNCKLPKLKRQQRKIRK